MWPFYLCLSLVSKPLLCVTVAAATTAELRQKRDAVADADLIELRLDSVSDPSAAGALAGRRQAVIVTCRPAWEGGGFKGSEEERRAILAEALALGAEYVDVEWRARFDDLISQSAGRRIVLSTHDFHGLPDGPSLPRPRHAIERRRNHQDRGDIDELERLHSRSLISARRAAARPRSC